MRSYVSSPRLAVPGWRLPRGDSTGRGGVLFWSCEPIFTGQPGAKDRRRLSVAAVASVRRSGRADGSADGGEPARAEPFGLLLPGQAGARRQIPWSGAPTMRVRSMTRSRAAHVPGRLEPVLELHRLPPRSRSPGAGTQVSCCPGQPRCRFIVLDGRYRTQGRRRPAPGSRSRTPGTGVSPARRRSGPSRRPGRQCRCSPLAAARCELP